MRVGPIYIEDDGGLTIQTGDGLRRLTAQTLVDAIGVETLRGPAGDAGLPGPGLPAAGTAGQIAVKASGTDYDLTWADLLADAAAGTASLRTLGAGARQAAAGNDARLSDTRTPTDRSVTSAKLADALKPSGSAAATDEALRRLGTGAGEAAPGVAAVGAVVYAGDARVARPTGYLVVFWLFPTGVMPTNMAGTDVLIETA